MFCRGCKVGLLNVSLKRQTRNDRNAQGGLFLFNEKRWDGGGFHYIMSQASPEMNLADFTYSNPA